MAKFKELLKAALNPVGYAAKTVVGNIKNTGKPAVKGRTVLPDAGISERLGIGKPNPNAVKAFGNPIMQDARNKPNTNTTDYRLGASTIRVDSTPNVSQQTTNNQSGGETSTKDPNANKPSNNSKNSGGGSRSSGGGTPSVSGEAGGSVPFVNTAVDGGGLDDIRAAWQLAQGDLQGQVGELDQSYALGKGDLDIALQETEQAGQTQQDILNDNYGQILRNQLQTYQDTGRQRMGTYAALGTLDSSAFGEEQLRADQSLAEGRLRTDTERARSVNEVQTGVENFRKKATSELSRLALQFQAGKNAIKSAMARNDLDSASALRQETQMLRDKAFELQNTLSMIKSLTDESGQVRTNIGNVNADQYGSEVSRQLASITQSGIPTYSPSQEGYFTSNGKKYRSYMDYLKNG